MNFFSRAFRRATNALTLFNPAAPGSDSTWQGFEITDSLSYNLTIIKDGKGYAAEKSVSQDQYKNYPHTYKSYNHGVIIGDMRHQVSTNPWEMIALNHPEEIWSELKLQAADKSLKDVRESGIGSADLMEMVFDLRLLDLDAIKEMINYKRDNGIFDKITAPEERALFDFRQTSTVPTLLLESSARKDNRPVVILEASYRNRDLHGGALKDFTVKYYSDNTANMIDALVDNVEIYNELFNDNNNVIIAGVDNLAITPKVLPAELLIKLKRQVVLNRLSDGERVRLLSVEKALQQEIRNNIIKITAHHGADEASNTVKTTFLWMSITEDGLRGTIQSGQYDQRSLNSMTPQELEEFYNKSKHDEDTKSLMESYFAHIDFDNFRKKKDWGARNKNQDNSMTVKEACKILGLTNPEENGIISKEDINRAFKTAAKMYHSDSGSLNKTAEEKEAATEQMQKINAARDFLKQKFG